MSHLAGFQPVHVEEIIDWSPELRTIVTSWVPENFQAGQFFQLGLRCKEGELVKRSYSAASGPGEKLAFYVRKVPQGQLTPCLFSLEKGSELLVDPQALGFFTISEIPAAKTLWLFATGTGLAPFLAYLKAGGAAKGALAQGPFSGFEKIVMVHGVAREDELSYSEEFASYAKLNPQLEFVAALSRQEPAAKARLGATRLLPGRITTLLASGQLEEELKLHIDTSAHVLLCGNPKMIEEVAELLKARGLQKHKRREPGHFNFERYW